MTYLSTLIKDLIPDHCALIPVKSSKSSTLRAVNLSLVCGWEISRVISCPID